MGINRIVVYDFEDGAVGAPFQSKGNYYPDGNYGDLYGGIDGPNAFVASGANSPLTPPVYASPGYQSTRSLELRNKMSDPLPRDGSPSSSYPYYTWNDGWGYRPDMNPPRLGRVCGIEVTFKVDPSVIRETIVSVALETSSRPPNRAFNSVSWNITSDPDGPILEHMFYSFGPFWVTLTVTDGDGNTDRVIHEVDLTGLRIDGDYVDDRCAFSGAS
jgi:hypothetical protein